MGYTPMALGGTGVLQISFDAVTSILRAGANNGAVAHQEIASFNRTGAGTGTVVNPFGFGVSRGSGWAIAGIDGRSSAKHSGTAQC